MFRIRCGTCDYRQASPTLKVPVEIGIQSGLIIHRKTESSGTGIIIPPD